MRRFEHSLFQVKEVPFPPVAPSRFTFIDLFAGYCNKRICQRGTRPGTAHLSRVHKQPNRIYSSEGVHPALPSQETSGRFFILHEGRVRKLTVNECYRIMGFPDGFLKHSSLTEQYRQIGNSVCVPMVTAIGEELLRQGFISGFPLYNEENLQTKILVI